jgi:hypothetical protein
MGRGSGCLAVRESVLTSYSSTALSPPVAPPPVRTVGMVDLLLSYVIVGISRASALLRGALALLTTQTKCGGLFPVQLSSYLSWGHGVVPVLCTCCMPLLVTNGCAYGVVGFVAVREDMRWGPSAISSLLICDASLGTCGLLWWKA